MHIYNDWTGNGYGRKLLIVEADLLLFGACWSMRDRLLDDYNEIRIDFSHDSIAEYLAASIHDTYDLITISGFFADMFDVEPPVWPDSTNINTVADFIYTTLDTLPTEYLMELNALRDSVHMWRVGALAKFHRGYENV